MHFRLFSELSHKYFVIYSQSLPKESPPNLAPYTTFDYFSCDSVYGFYGAGSSVGPCEGRGTINFTSRSHWATTSQLPKIAPSIRSLVCPALRFWLTERCSSNNGSRSIRSRITLMGGSASVSSRDTRLPSSRKFGLGKRLFEGSQRHWLTGTPFDQLRDVELVRALKNRIALVF